MRPTPKPPASPRGRSGLLAQTASLIWGPNFIMPLAEHLKVNRRTVRRWLQEEHPIPTLAWHGVYSALSAHGKRVEDFRSKVETRL
jgi:hypothetical protein